MTIKDAARHTGLTPKSIRYYESKGLLRVERGPENAYRQYTEEDIERLKLIKLLRWLGLSVEEIAARAEADWAGLPEALEQHSLRLEHESQSCLDRRNLCDKLAKDWKTGDRTTLIAAYDETLTFIESEEGRGMLSLLEQNLCMSLPATVISSLVWLGPIGWLFFRIFTRSWEALPGTAVAALLAAAALTLEWTGYFRMRKQRKIQARETDRRNRALLPLVLLAILGSIALVIGLFLIRERLLAPAGWLFYEAPWWADLGLLLFTVLLVLSLIGLLARRTKLAAAELEDMADLPSFLLRTWKASVPLLVLAVYCCFISGTYVTDTGILRRTPLNPAGTTYAYSDVARVEAGFGSARFALPEYKRRGQFYYRIILSDGAEAVFHAPQPNNDVARYSEGDATGLELEEFDAALMALGVSKTASETNWEFCEYDRQFVDRFLRILRNLPAAS